MKNMIALISVFTVLSSGPLFSQEQYFGSKIDDKNTVRPPEFLKTMDGRDSLYIKLEAPIAACCQKKGCWMDLELGDGTTMKVRFKDYGFFVPKDSGGKTAIVKGRVKKEVVDVATLKHYAEDAGKSEEEVAAITEPKLSFTFEAEGVIIR